MSEIARGVLVEGRRLWLAGAGWWALGAAAMVAGMAWPDLALETARFVAGNLLVLAPVWLFAAVLTGYLRASGADDQIARIFAGRSAKMIWAATLFGAVTPICGIGVLPIIAGLLGAGVPLAPIMAFWLASPITDPAMLAITSGTLGLSFAVGKTAAAVGIGLLGGFATEALAGRGAFPMPLKAAGLARAGADPGGCDASGPEALAWRVWREPIRRRAFRRTTLDSALLMLKWLALALALESLLRDQLSPALIADWVGAGQAWAIPLAVTVGAPIYLDGYAALPLVRGLMDLGMTPGAAMAFLVAGGITSAYASVAVFALVRLPVFLWYIGLAVIGSALSGYAFEVLMSL
ncbi:MAG: permease [Kiloniellales bacterium]